MSLLDQRRFLMLMRISFVISFLFLEIFLEGTSATKILLKTRPNTYFHLPFEFSHPSIRNGPEFIKFLDGHLVGVANDSNGIYSFELVEDNSVVDVELLVQRENGLCYDPTQQIFSKALTLEEKLSIAKQSEQEVRINGKSRGLEFIDKKNGHFDDSSKFTTTLRYEIPCQDYYASVNALNENKLESSFVDTRSRAKRQGNHDHLAHLEGSGGDGDDVDIDENEEYDEEDEDEDIEERVVPSLPTPTFEMASKTLIPIELDTDNFIEPMSSSSSMEFDGFPMPMPTPSASLSSATRSVSLPLTFTIQATPTLHYPHHDLLSSSALMFENLSDGGSGDFEIAGHLSTTTRPTPAPHFEHDHDHIVIDPTISNEPNLPAGPILKRRFDKILIPAGTVLRYEIPRDAFITENNLLFQLESENGTVISRSLDSTPWIRFVGESTIVFSPPTDHVSDYTYYLIATDERTHARTSTELLISVKQRRKSRMYNHEFELTYTKLPKGEISDFIAKIVSFARGNTTTGTFADDLILTKMEADGHIFKIKWTNETLYGEYNLNSCPKDDLTAIYKRLANSEGEPTPGFKSFLQPTYTPILLNISFPFLNSHCDGIKPTNITKSTSQDQEPTRVNKNYPPTIKNQVDQIDATEGEYLIYKVLADFCYDPEDGNTKSLDLKLLDSNSIKINESNWLQFDGKNQEFYGLPMNSGNDVESYVLMCTDSGGKSVNDALDVKISPQQKTSYSAEFSLHFQSVPFTPQNMRKFLTKLATVFNDSITNIVVKNYQENVNQNVSQVHFRWFNKSDPSTEFELTELGRVLLSEAGPPNKKVVDYFSPEFNLSGGQVIPKGKLLGSGTPHHFDIGGGGKSDEAGAHGGDEGITISNADKDITDGTYVITYIIPAVLIFVMILLASLIACLLSRKRKAIPTSTEEETKRFIKKGVPVIFQDELEDASYNSGRGGMADLGTGSRSRSPAILREERPPLPPSYNRRSPPNIDYRNSASNQPSYQPPPPPVARTILPSATRGMRPGAGSAAANYRKPPPYVPP